MNCSKQNKTKHHISVYVKLPVPTDEPQSTLARFGGTFVGRQKQENCEFEVSMSYKIKQNSSPTKTKQNKSRYLCQVMQFRECCRAWRLQTPGGNKLLLARQHFPLRLTRKMWLVRNSQVDCSSASILHKFIISVFRKIVSNALLFIFFDLEIVLVNRF